MSTVTPAHPSRSAELVTLLRAVYSLPEAWPQLEDTHAAGLLRSSGHRLVYQFCARRAGLSTVTGMARMLLGESHLYIPLRTLYIDAVLEQALARSVRQVVLLGAGYDTRAFRAAERYPELRCVEVDLPATQALKREALAEHPALGRGQVRMVSADLRQPGWTRALAEAGLSGREPTLFIAEGLLPYLSVEETEGLFRAIRAFQAGASGCRVVFTYLPPRPVRRPGGLLRLLSALHRPARESFATGLEPELLAARLEGLGFSLEEELDFRALYRRFNAQREPQERWAVPFRLALATVHRDTPGRGRSVPTGSQEAR
jgi:methyltransferase (TIGR00027 family)